MEEVQDAKRVRSDQVPVDTHATQAWPSQASLYGRGLESRAETHTRSDSWVVEGRTWRHNFTAADGGGNELQKRQAEMRRQLLRPTLVPTRDAPS